LHIQISWKEMKPLCSRAIWKLRYVEVSYHDWSKQSLKYHEQDKKLKCRICWMKLTQKKTVNQQKSDKAVRYINLLLLYLEFCYSEFQNKEINCHIWDIHRQCKNILKILKLY
jgi:hypothetical protein